MRTKAKKPEGGPTGFLVGYARVSTQDQKLDLQIDALRKAGVKPDNLHVEKVSGASKRRPALDLAIKDLMAGDTLVVWRLDRFARSMRDLYARLDQVYAKGAYFRSLTEAFDFGTVTGKFVLGILGLVAELERQLIAQRTSAGIQTWKERSGRGWGREIVMTPEKVERAGRYLNAGKSGPWVANKLRVSTASIYAFWRRRRRDGVWVRKTPTDRGPNARKAKR